MEPGTAKDTQQSPRYNAEEWRLATLTHSAIAGVSLAATVELANSPALSTWLLVSVILFALALPSSVSSVVLLLYFQARNQSNKAVLKRPFWSVISSLLALIAQLTGFGGVLFLFWHIHWIAGITFLSTSLVAVITLVALGRK